MVSKIKKYEKLLVNWITEYLAPRQDDDIKMMFVFDKQNKHYQIVETGWFQNKYVYDVLLHFHISEDAKVWILTCQLDIDLDDELEGLKIPKTDIVPAFQPKEVRGYAGYGVS